MTAWGALIVFLVGIFIGVMICGLDRGILGDVHTSECDSVDDAGGGESG